MENEKVIARAMVKGISLDDLQKAIQETILSARCAHDSWHGLKLTPVENCDGFTPHSMELVQELLSDGSKALKVRFLFVGDV